MAGTWLDYTRAGLRVSQARTARRRDRKTNAAVAAPKYVLVKGNAGLGNRLYAALSGALYARLSGRRLLIDWTDWTYSNDGSNVFTRFFVSRSAGADDEIPDTDSVNPWMWRGHLRTSPFDMLMAHAPAVRHDPLAGLVFSFNPSRLDHDEELLVMWSYNPLINRMRRHFRGALAAWQHLDDLAILRHLMHDALELHPSLATRIADISRNCGDAPRIGVHVRQTDKRTNLRLIKDRVAACQKRLPEARIFLATDSGQVEEEFRRDYPDVLTAPKWYPPSGTLHGREECPDRSLNLAEALIDLYLLAGCAHLIIDSSSSLGHLALVVGSTPPRTVIDVRSGHRLPPWLRQVAWDTYSFTRWGIRRRWIGTPQHQPRL